MPIHKDRHGRFKINSIAHGSVLRIHRVHQAQEHPGTRLNHEFRLRVLWLLATRDYRLTNGGALAPCDWRKDCGIPSRLSAPKLQG